LDGEILSGGIWDNERLRFAMEAAGIALWSWNVDTDRITLDDRALDLWGLTGRTSVTFEELSAQIHPADLDKVRASFAATREQFGPYDTDFRIVCRGEVRWISARGKGYDKGIIGRIMYGVFIDISVRKLAEEARELITGEMHHRIKNLFSLTAALAGIASRTTPSKEAMTTDLIQRLVALSEAHQLIRPDGSSQSRAIELRDLIAILLKPYSAGEASEAKVAISLPDLLIGEKSATALALIIHELATNSMKYGALSSPEGCLALSGNDSDSEIEIIWKETGGPVVVTVPQSGGFGSRLVRASVKDQLGGSISINWPPEGIVVTLRLNKGRLGA
jgi:two-component sensor histidine kinase